MQRFAIIGLGRFGYLLATKLVAAGNEVIAIDKDRQIVEEIRDQVTLSVATDVTDEEALRSQGVDRVDVAVVGIGDDFEATVLATVVLKQLEVPRVISRATTDIRGRILLRVGADEVVNPEDESAESWSVRLTWPQFISHFELEPGFSIIEICTPQEWVGQTLAQLRLRATLGVHVVAVKRVAVTRPSPDQQDGGGPIRMPRPTHVLDKHDVLMVMGRDEDLARLPKPE